MATFRIWSDLHLESGNWDESWFENSEGQYLILAGDIMEIRKIPRILEFFEKCNECFLKVFYVPGNHEFWEAYIEKWEWARQYFKDQGLTNLILMQKDKYELTEEGITVFGATMWYDASHLNIGLPRAFLKQESKDYKYIGTRKHDVYIALRPTDVIGMNVEHVLWLEQEVPAVEGKKIVITHHAPTPFSKDPGFDNDHKEYVNDLDLTKIPADLWVHGHVHYSHWYQVDDVVVTSNPRGYEIYNAVNPRFDPQYTVEV